MRKAECGTSGTTVVRGHLLRGGRFRQSRFGVCCERLARRTKHYNLYALTYVLCVRIFVIFFLPTSLLCISSVYVARARVYGVLAPSRAYNTGNRGGGLATRVGHHSCAVVVLTRHNDNILYDVRGADEKRSVGLEFWSAIRRKRRDSSFCAPRSRRPVLYAQFNARPEHARRVVIKILKIVLLFTIRPRPQNERTEQRTTAVFFSHIPRGWCEKLVYFLYRVSDFGGRWCFFFFFCLFCCCCLFCCVAKRASENTNECICKTLSGCGARNAPPPSESEKKNKSYGLFFSYLHSCSPPIIHGNLTCDTIFIQHNGLVKIGSGKVPHERNMPCKGKHIYQKKNTYNIYYKKNHTIK